MGNRIPLEKARDNLLDILELVATGAPLDDSKLYAIRDISTTSDARVKFSLAAFAQYRVSMLPELLKSIQTVREELAKQFDVANMSVPELLRLAEHLRMDIDSIYKQGLSLVSAAGDQFGGQRWTSAELTSDDPASSIQVNQLDRESRNKLRNLFALLERESSEPLQIECGDNGKSKKADKPTQAS